MLSRLAKFCVLGLLAVSIGGPWALLQSIAWMGMLIDYSRDASMTEAVSRTFDGKHPCSLCKAIENGKKSQQKKDFSFKLQKLEFPLFSQDQTPVVPPPSPWPSCGTPIAKSASLKPPTPPPRALAFV